MMQVKQIKRYNLAFYDRHGCYDEMRIDPYQLKNLEYALACIDPQNSTDNGDYERLFVFFDDGSQGEINFKMLDNG